MELVYNYGGLENSPMCSLDLYPKRESKAETTEMPRISDNGMSQAPKSRCCSLMWAKGFLCFVACHSIVKGTAAPGSEDFICGRIQLVILR